MKQVGTGERGGDGRFVRGVSGNPSGRPSRVRVARYFGWESGRRAEALVAWVLLSALRCSAASVAAGSGELLAGADALELAADTLRGLACCRVAVDSHGTTEAGFLPAGGRA